MTELTFSRSARYDLQQIYEYIEQDDITAALNFLDRLEEKCQLLARTPEMGFAREELALRLRCWPVGAYVIYYRPQGAGIEVVRVLHGARDVERLF